MQRPLKITSRDFPLSAAFESEIKEKAAALDDYYNHISGCEVTVEAPVGHHRKGGPFGVNIRLTVPGKELITNHQSEEGLAAAIREAFDAARRQLEDYARAQRGAVKVHEEMPRARVIRLVPDQGYGFLQASDGREIYFHRNSVLRGGFDKIKVGTEVRFAEEEGTEGPQASTVAIVGGRKKTVI